MRDLESRDLAGAEHFAAADAEPPEPPHPSEYEGDALCPECGLLQPGAHRGTCSHSLMRGGPGYGLYACPTCGENVTRYGRRCDRCERNLEEDRLERESGR